MRGQIYAHREGITTARKLGGILGVPVKLSTIYRSRDWIFRYGQSDIFPPGKSPRLVINEAQGIRLVSNKPKFRNEMEGIGISVPHVFHRDERLTFPSVARPHHHTRGENFNIVNSTDEAWPYIERGYYVQSLIENIRHEYRVFVFNGEILEVDVKKPLSDSASPIIRNHTNGWGFTPLVSVRPSEALIRAVLKSVELSGLTWCAVDCCICRGDKPYIFEVNSAPALIDRKAELLAGELRKYIEEVL